MVSFLKQTSFLDEWDQLTVPRREMEKEGSFILSPPTGVVALQEMPIDDGDFNQGQISLDPGPFPGPLQIPASQFYLVGPGSVLPVLP